MIKPGPKQSWAELCESDSEEETPKNNSQKEMKILKFHNAKKYEQNVNKQNIKIKFSEDQNQRVNKIDIKIKNLYSIQENLQKDEIKQIKPIENEQKKEKYIPKKYKQDIIQQINNINNNQICLNIYNLPNSIQLSDLQRDLQKFNLINVKNFKQGLFDILLSKDDALLMINDDKANVMGNQLNIRLSTKYHLFNKIKDIKKEKYVKSEKIEEKEEIVTVIEQKKKKKTKKNKKIENQIEKEEEEDIKQDNNKYSIYNIFFIVSLQMIIAGIGLKYL